MYLRSVNIKANQKDKITFDNAECYRQLTEYDIQWDIHNDDWTIDNLRVPSEISKIDNFQHKIYYCDIIEIIQFFLDHKSFKDNLTYASVKIKNDNDCIIYNEMYIDEWWWETQLQISAEDTVVFIIIASDKTVMNQHHDDLFLWFVYVIIENLDCTTRKMQKRSDLVLLDLLSCVKHEKKIDNQVRSKVYHLVIKHMLQRMYAQQFQFRSVC